MALFLLKRCRGECGALLPVSKFYRRSGSNGHRHACIRCMLQAKHGYSIDNETYDAFIIAQTGRCAICLVQFSDEVLPCVDHCHETKRVRGILCPGCNLGIGYLKDDPVRIRVAAEYVQEA